MNSIVQKNIFDYSQFLKGLNRAAASVTLITSKFNRNPVCTGWLLTKNLVVIPNYAIDSTNDSTQFECWWNGDGESVFKLEAQLITPVNDIKLITDPKGMMPALLRLERPLYDRAASLEMTSLQESDTVVLLHHPMGSQQLKISIGVAKKIEAGLIYHYTDSDFGSAGAPLLNMNGGVVGIHVGGNGSYDVNNRVAIAKTISSYLEAWRKGPEWTEIAAYHQLVSLGAEMKVATDIHHIMLLGKDLLREAVQWSFKPEQLPEDKRERVRELVIDEEASYWIFRSPERHRIICQAHSLKDLQKARGRDSISGIRQAVIDRIIQGPPYKPEELLEEELPYWLQAVSWFKDLIPELPSIDFLQRLLEQKRIRKKLELIVGSDFQGRETELIKMMRWYPNLKKGPLVVSGIGGIGKSSLIAKFILNLSSQTTIFWLDFDRADLAPDDAQSLLKAIEDQLVLQLEGFERAPADKPWNEKATTLGHSLLQTINNGFYPVLIMDGFEVAQHVKKYNEIWQVLEKILLGIPVLRIVVSGRAPVKHIPLKGPSPEALPLMGMDEKNAFVWMENHGIDEHSVQKKIFSLSHGIPLILKMAVRLQDEGENLKELPNTLSKEMVQGYLYQRILDRVINPSLKDVAQDALVLRRLSVGMVNEVLKHRLPKKMSAKEVFQQLMREMGLIEEASEGGGSHSSLTLVGEENILHLRPEVRAATLRLLEMDQPSRVREMDNKAIAWYQKSDLNDPAERAELIYHLLRVGRLKEAQAFWLEECSPWLEESLDELPAGAKKEKNWLKKQLTRIVLMESVKAWENDALTRILKALERGRQSSVGGILREKEERSSASPLLLYDAWQLKNEGQLEMAYNLLSETKLGVGERQFLIIRAMLARLMGNKSNADLLLARLDNLMESELPGGIELDQLLLRSARIRLTLDIESELDLFHTLSEYKSSFTELDTLRRFFIPMDIVLPLLIDKLQVFKEESFSQYINIPEKWADIKEFRKKLSHLRHNYSAYANASLEISDNVLELPKNWKNDLGQEMGKRYGHPMFEQALKLSEEAWKRWHLVSQDLFLFQAGTFMSQSEMVNPEEGYAIFNTLIVLHRQPFYITSLGISSMQFMRLIANSWGSRSILNTIPAENITLAKRVLESANFLKGSEMIITWLDQFADRKMAASSDISRLFLYLEGSLSFEMQSVFYLLLSPDPLELLCKRLLRLPPSMNF